MISAEAEGDEGLGDTTVPLRDIRQTSSIAEVGANKTTGDDPVRFISRERSVSEYLFELIKLYREKNFIEKASRARKRIYDCNQASISKRALARAIRNPPCPLEY